MAERDEGPEAGFDPVDIANRVRAIEDHTNRNRYLTEHDVIPLLRGIYDQVHATRHAIDRLVSLLEGGMEGGHDA